MKKFLFLSISLILFITPSKIQALAAEAAILIDQDSGRVLFSKNANDQKLIASTTKIMTALIALENSKLDKKITVGEEILKAYGSAIYVEIGEEVTLKDLLYGLMLRSGNDAALVIAKNVAKSEEKFVTMMNDKALELGMKNTHFYNPHGLENDDGTANTSTAYDMALLMKEAMENEDFRQITATKSYTLKTNKKTYVWQNKNKLLTTYEYTTGGKTGFTKKARRTLVTSASKDHKNLIAVTLNDPNDFTDHQKLYEEYFAKYNLVTIIDHEDYQLTDKEYKNKILYLKKDFKLLLTKEEEKEIKVDVKINKKDKFTNSKIAGTVSVTLDDNILAQENIYYKDKNTKSNKTSIWEKIKSWFS